MAKSSFDKKAYAAEIEGKMQEHDAYGDPAWVFFWLFFDWLPTIAYESNPMGMEIETRN